jgi:hypothetical protein
VDVLSRTIFGMQSSNAARSDRKSHATLVATASSAVNTAARVSRKSVQSSTIKILVSCRGQSVDGAEPDSCVLRMGFTSGVDPSCKAIALAKRFVGG